MQHMLSTADNPFDPFDSFDAWDTWDKQHGYHSSAYLARVVITSEELPEAEQLLDIERAIDEIVRQDILNVHIKVSRDIKDEESSTTFSSSG